MAGWCVDMCDMSHPGKRMTHAARWGSLLRALHPPASRVILFVLL
jgi:hypothetical protein